MIPSLSALVPSPHRLHLQYGFGALRCIKRVAISCGKSVQLRNTPSILVQSWRAQRGVPLFLRRIADPTHLIDGDDA
jgi:hypothetical protein